MNLIDEISKADADLQAAETETTVASKSLRECKLRLRNCRAELSRLIKELRTGESRYPLLERIGGNGETAPPGPGPWSEAELAGGDGGPLARAEAEPRPRKKREITPPDPTWTDADLDAAIDSSCYPSAMDDAAERWRELRAAGCDDARILEVLRAIWPGWQVHIPAVSGVHRGYTTQGGPVPKFWPHEDRCAPRWRESEIGKPVAPLLSGLQLADRIRTVLSLPRVPVPVETTQNTKSTKRRRA